MSTATCTCGAPATGRHLRGDTLLCAACFADRTAAELDAAPWHADLVSIDELVEVIGQYRDDVRWNGWLCPSMDALAVETVLAAFREDYEEYGGDQPVPTHEWMDDGSLLLTQYDGDTAYPEVIPADEDGLYPLGAYCWVWSAGGVDGLTLEERAS